MSTKKKKKTRYAVGFGSGDDAEWRKQPVSKEVTSQHQSDSRATHQAQSKAIASVSQAQGCHQANHDSARYVGPDEYYNKDILYVLDGWTHRDADANRAFCLNSSQKGV